MITARPRFWRRPLATLLAALMALPAGAGAQVRLPSLGEAASTDLSVGAEKRLGDQIMREARRDPAYLDDPVLLAYVQALWSPLVGAARKIGNIDSDTEHAFPFEVFLVRDRSVNAFALPGGYVGIHLGLIAIASTPDQLASVLAHELTHVTQRHIARGIAPQQQASMLAIATMLLGIIAASRAGNTDIANAAIMSGQGAAIQSQLNFSRDMEREADRIGYGLMEQAGYAPAGMAAMFEKMDQASRLNDNSSFPYLRSHPLTVDRVSEARSRSLLGGRPTPTQGGMLHTMMMMRARVLMDDSVQGLQRLNGATASPALADRVAAVYGSAMAASLLKDHNRAVAQISAAQQLLAGAQPREPQAERMLSLLQTQVLLAKGDAPAAMQVLDKIDGTGTERAAMLLRAQAALALQRADATAAVTPLRQSTESLQTWLAEHPSDPMAWELLSGTSEALGLKLRAMRAGAEARYAVGDLTGAVDRLRNAQTASRQAAGQDFIEASVIDSRLRTITAQRRALQLEARGERPRDEAPPP